MQIKKIKLENIRSYEQAELEFPLGSVLFAGDIGSGKSSVLYALEFALFGLQPGFMSGSGLLRKGEEKGSVEIDLEINNKQIKIKRTLERKKTVNQGKDCFIEISGERKKLSPEDLKAKVLELLNYSQSMLKSRSNLLYRFTIYCPQEEMKQILVEKPEERINTLRKIFGIDKYKNILSNLEIISSKIKEKIKLNEAMIIDLDFKKQEKSNYEEKKHQEEKEIKEISPLLALLQEDLARNKSIIKEIEEKIKESQKIKTEIASLTANLENVEEQKARYHKEIEKIDKELQQEMQNSALISKNMDFRKEINALNSNFESSDKTQKELISKIASHEYKKRENELLKARILSLIECPTCRQKVSDEHKKLIMKETDSIIKSCDENLSKLNKEYSDTEKNISELKKKIDSLHEKEREDQSFRLRLKMLAEKKKLRDNNFDFLRNLTEKQFCLEDKLKLLKNEFSSENLDEKYKEHSKNFEQLSKRERDLAIKKAQHENQLKYYVLKISELDKEIKIKETILAEISKLKKLNEWLLEHLSELLLSIEKNVMLAINLEFNKMFEKWFSMLTENISARINEDFTPIIEQQGYEIDYDALSGGERTAAALSYRLALNQIINNLMSRLNTQGLLILDEPTDGFSSEQLERMRNILDELKTEQLILVSHESEIENFVKNIIKFEKRDGKSRIL